MAMAMTLSFVLLLKADLLGILKIIVTVYIVSAVINGTWSKHALFVDK